MAVRAKFTCQQVTKYTGGTTQVKLNAVTDITDGGTVENKSFWNATPSGTLDISISNPDAAEFFEAGKAYYLDFTEAA